MKPIAYFAKDSDGWWAETDKESGIPLYTAPRELSDEEIDEVVKKTYGESRNPAVGACYRRLARAILKKASEK